MTDITADQIDGAEVIDTFGGSNKTLELIEINGEKVLTAQKSDFEDGEINHIPQERTALNNNLRVPSELRDMGVNAPETESVGDYVVMEYVEGTPVREVDEAEYEQDQLLDVQAAIIASGNPDAADANIILTPDGEMYAIDFDWAGCGWTVALREFAMMYDVDDETVDKIESRAESLLY